MNRYAINRTRRKHQITSIWSIQHSKLSAQTKSKQTLQIHTQTRSEETSAKLLIPPPFFMRFFCNTETPEIKFEFQATTTTKKKKACSPEKSSEKKKNNRFLQHQKYRKIGHAHRNRKKTGRQRRRRGRRRRWGRTESGEFGDGGKIGKKIAGDASHLFVFLGVCQITRRSSSRDPSATGLSPTLWPKPNISVPNFR